MSARPMKGTVPRQARGESAIAYSVGEAIADHNVAHHNNADGKRKAEFLSLFHVAKRRAMRRKCPSFCWRGPPFSAPKNGSDEDVRWNVVRPAYPLAGEALTKSNTLARPASLRPTLRSVHDGHGGHAVADANLIDRVHAVEDAPEDGVVVVEERRRSKRNVELARSAVRV